MFAIGLPGDPRTAGVPLDRFPGGLISKTLGGSPTVKGPQSIKKKPFNPGSWPPGSTF